MLSSCGFVHTTQNVFPFSTVHPSKCAGEEGQLTEEDDEAVVLRQELELLRKEMEQVPRDTVK
jgi:hypothetical protein